METRAMTNDEQAARSGDAAARWLLHEEHHERMLAPFAGHLLTAAAVGRDDQVVDIGCGTGSTTRAAGRIVVKGKALGVDLSLAMLREAARRAREEGLTNVRFDHGDAQVHAFTPGTSDVAISRFGVMFFIDPVAAFANIARGLRKGGRLAFVCWQKPGNNEWIVVPRAAAAQHAELQPLDDPTAPGPFSLGERDRAVTVLRAAAFSDLAIEPVTERLWMGADVPDAMAFLESMGIWDVVRDADALAAARVRETVQAALEPYVTPDGVLMGARAWLLTAKKH
jgi:SAM-dependent methyltransferase